MTKARCLSLTAMKLEWDENKRASNKLKHGFDFLDAHLVFTDEALIEEDRRTDYGEKRYTLIGHLSNRLVIVIFSQRDDSIRIISMRKANHREQKKYDQKRLASH